MAPTEADDFTAVLETVVGLLDRAEIPYLLTGAIVRNIFGDVRTSRDLDVVVHPDHADPDDLRALFEGVDLEVEGPRRGDLGERLVIATDPVQTDLWLAPDTPLHRSEFERAVPREVGDRTLVVMHPQDYVLRKLVNTKVRRAGHDIDDAYQVLLFAWDEIDPETLVEDAHLHRIGGKARELVDLVRSDREQLERGETPEGV